MADCVTLSFTMQYTAEGQGILIGDFVVGTCMSSVFFLTVVVIGGFFR